MDSTKSEISLIASGFQETVHEYVMSFFRLFLSFNRVLCGQKYKQETCVV